MMNFTNTWNQEPAAATVAATVPTPVTATVTSPAVSISDDSAPMDPTVTAAIQNEQDIFSNLLQEMALQDFLFEDEMRRVATRFTMRSSCQETSNDTIMDIIGLNADDDDDDAPTSLPGTSNFSSALGLPVFDMNSLLGFSAS